jgi:erythromycin esterase-like protein
MLSEATPDLLRQAAVQLVDGEAGDYDPLLKLTDGARAVLLGISSHGSHDLFRARAELTRRLIEDMGFSLLALDASADVVEPIDAYVRGLSDRGLVENAPGRRSLFPTGVWRNSEMLDFVVWLRSYNDQFETDTYKVRVQTIDFDSPRKSVVWAHSRFVGDARATDASTPSLGQRARERFGRRAVLVGFSTYSGHVSALDRNGRSWRETLDAAPAGGYEAVFHAAHLSSFLLLLRDAPDRLTSALREPRLERMVDAMSGSDTDPHVDYLRARLADQFDALIHFDHTRALQILDASGPVSGVQRLMQLEQQNLQSDNYETDS